MSHPASRAVALAVGAAASLAAINPAAAHVVVGNRFFPATLLIDDPGVNDELSLPTFAYLTNPDGSQQYDFAFEYSKRITPDFGISISDNFTHLANPAANGWGNLSTDLKYVLFLNAEHEFIFSVGVGFDWGHTGNASVGAETYTAWSPQVWFGKGFGDLPTDLNALRPFAVTGQFGADITTHPVTTSIDFDEDGLATVNLEQNPTFFNWGFTLQYSLPYLNANVSALNNDFLSHLIPLVEVAFAAPMANIGPVGGGNSHSTIGLVNPGVIYSGQYFQIGIEAQIPVNSLSGKHVGVLAQLHFYLDNIFPDSIGRPIFPGRRSAFGDAS